MLAKEQVDELLQRNGNVLTAGRDKIGSIAEVYADDDNGPSMRKSARNASKRTATRTVADKR